MNSGVQHERFRCDYPSFLFSAPLSLAARDDSHGESKEITFAVYKPPPRCASLSLAQPRHVIWRRWHDNATGRTFFLSQPRWAMKFLRLRGGKDRPVSSQAGISFNSSLTSNRDFYGTVIGNHGISSSPTLLSRPPDPLYWRFYWKGRVNLGIEENGSSFQSDKYIIISWYCFEN